MYIYDVYFHQTHSQTAGGEQVNTGYCGGWELSHRGAALVVLEGLNVTGSR